MFWYLLTLLFTILLLLLQFFSFHVNHDGSKVKCKDCDEEIEGKKNMYNQNILRNMSVESVEKLLLRQEKKLRTQMVNLAKQFIPHSRNLS